MLGAQADRLPRDVDRRVAASDDGHAATDLRRASGLERLDERQRAPDAVEVLPQEPGGGVGTHPDGEDDRVVRRGECVQLRPVDSSAEDDSRTEPLHEGCLLRQRLVELAVGRDPEAD